jgi:hypothetical protein
MVVHDLAMRDYFNLPNAIFRFQDPVSVPAVVSFDLRWTGATGGPQSITNTGLGFTGTFVPTHATMSWSARSPDLTFVSAAASTSTAVAALLGDERNGRFA